MVDPKDKFEAHVAVGSDTETAVELLQQETGLSKGRLKAAMTKGAVWISRGSNTQRLRRATRDLHTGDELHIYYDEKVLSEVPSAPELIADVGEYSVWRKPYGLRSQGSRWGDHCTLARWSEKHLQPERPAFTVHRLDRSANGLMIVAHAKRTAAALSKLFRERLIQKRYIATVWGDFSAMESPLRMDHPIQGKSARSVFSLVRVEGNRSIVDVEIETGRKHQIRIHLAELGFPIVGDRLYGGSKSTEVDMLLTAYLLKFKCPVTEEITEYRLADTGI